MLRQWIWLIALASAACTPAEAAYTPPPALASFDLQYTGKIDYDTPVKVLNLDGFDTPAETVVKLRQNGVYPICYINAGASEDWRPDMAAFPKEIIGKAYDGWAGENWLDIRRIDLLGPIMIKRLEMCAEKGFLGVDPDNLDSFQQDTGFTISREQQVAYLVWLAKEAHKHGLAIGLKNAPELRDALLPYYDWVLTESCFEQGWCEDLLPFQKAGKAVFVVEYTDENTNLEALCAHTKPLGYNAIIKNRELDQLRKSCQ